MTLYMSEMHRLTLLNPFKLAFTIVISIQYKTRIAVAILDLYWMKMTWCGLKLKKITMYW